MKKLPAEIQGTASIRYALIPRVLVFVFDNKRVLLQKGASKKKLWAGLYNGVGGHVERSEDFRSAAFREIFEETGLKIKKINLAGIQIIDTESNPGVIIGIFWADCSGSRLIASEEGKLEWLEIAKINKLPVVPDLTKIMSFVLKNRKTGKMFYGLSKYDKKGKLRIDIAI